MSDDFSGFDEEPPVEVTPVTREIKPLADESPGLFCGHTKQSYVEQEVEITRQRYQHDENLKDRLERSRAYADWRWEGVHTTLDGVRVPDEVSLPVEMRQIAYL